MGSRHFESLSPAGLWRGAMAGVLAVIVAVILLVASDLWREQQEIVTQAQSMGLNLARVIGDQTEAMIKTIDQALLRSAAQLGANFPPAPPEEAPRPEPSPLLLAIKGDIAYLRSLTFYDAAGRARLSSLARPPPQAVAGERWFLRHREDLAQGLQITVAETGRSGEPAFLLLSRSVVGPDGRFAGVITAVPERQYLQQQYDALAVGGGGVISLSLQSGLVLIRSPEEAGLVGVSAANLPLYREMIEDPARSGVQRGPYVSDRRVRLVGWWKLPVGGLVVRVAMAEDEVLAGWYAGLSGYALGTAVFVALLGGLGLLLIIQLRRRERAEIARHESERFAAATIEALSTLVCVLDQDGVILASNRAWREAGPPAGTERLDIGFNYLALCDTATGPDAGSDRLLAQGIRAVIRGERPTHTQECHRDTGSGRIWFTSRVTRFAGPGPVRVVVSHQDVSDRHRALEALLKEKERSETYLAIAEAIIVELDDQAVIRRINRQGCLTLGYTESELVGQSWIDTCIPESEHPTLRSVHAMVMAGALQLTEYYENEVLTRDHQLRCIWWHNAVLRDEAGRIVGTISSGVDITERRRMENELRASERRLTKAQTIAQLGNWEHDLSSGIVWWSQEIYRILERRPEILGNTWDDYLSYVHPDDFRPVIRACEQLVEDGAPLYLDHRILLPDGRQRFVLLQGELLRDEHGRPQRTTGILHDITVRKRAEIELRRAMQQTALAHRTKSEFIANVSHEFNTPLNAVIGFSALMSEQAFGPLGHAKYQEFSRDIHAAGQNLQEIVEDILEISKINMDETALAETVFDLIEVIVERIRNLSAEIRAAGLTFETNLPDHPVLIQADRRLVKQILRNLLSNAIKFTPGEGKITVALTTEDDGRLRLLVADTGIGIAEDNIARVFERFSQIDTAPSRSHDGIGLGLSLSKAMIERHGGRIALTSRLGQGTRVSVWFPASRVMADETDGFGARPEPVA